MALPGPRSQTHQRILTTRENMTVSSEPTSDPLAYFDQLTATVEEIGRLRWMLGQVLSLADDAPGLTQHTIVQDPGGVTLPR
jgi:hypothetical protein